MSSPMTCSTCYGITILSKRMWTNQQHARCIGIRRIYDRDTARRRWVNMFKFSEPLTDEEINEVRRSLPFAILLIQSRDSFISSGTAAHQQRTACAIDDTHGLHWQNRYSRCRVWCERCHDGANLQRWNEDHRRRWRRWGEGWKQSKGCGWLVHQVVHELNDWITLTILIILLHHRATANCGKMMIMVLSHSFRHRVMKRIMRLVMMRIVFLQTWKDHGRLMFNRICVANPKLQKTSFVVWDGRLAKTADQNFVSQSLLFNCWCTASLCWSDYVFKKNSTDTNSIIITDCLIRVSNQCRGSDHSCRCIWVLQKSTATGFPLGLTRTAVVAMMAVTTIWRHSRSSSSRHHISRN